MEQIWEYFKPLFTNYVFLSALISWFLAQIIKVIIGLFNRKGENLLKIFFSTGGMPSSHSSSVMGLCMAAGIKEGLGSTVFAATFVLAGIVMTDASGVRYQTGQQNIILKRITQKLFSEDANEINAGLKELVGHTRTQVYAGAALGLVVAIIMKFIMNIPWTPLA